MADNHFEEELLRKLNVIISLLLDLTPQNERPVTSKIEKLSGIGLAPAEIGRVLGKGTNYVGAVLGSKKKGKK